MIYNKTVESFLSKVYEALGDVPISEKADIIVDLYDYIEEKSEADSKSSTVIIKEMGLPETIAEKIRVNRKAYQWEHIKKSSSLNLFHWIIFFLSTVLFFLFLILGAILWKISPIVQVTSEGTTLFGGLIQLDKHNTPKLQISVPDHRGSPPVTCPQKTLDNNQRQNQILLENADKIQAPPPKVQEVIHQEDAP